MRWVKSLGVAEQQQHVGFEALFSLQLALLMVTMTSGFGYQPGLKGKQNIYKLYIFL